MTTRWLEVQAASWWSSCMESTSCERVEAINTARTLVWAVLYCKCDLCIILRHVNTPGISYQALALVCACRYYFDTFRAGASILHPCTAWCHTCTRTAPFSNSGICAEVPSTWGTPLYSLRFHNHVKSDCRICVHGEFYRTFVVDSLCFLQLQLKVGVSDAVCLSWRGQASVALSVQHSWTYVKGE